MTVIHKVVELLVLQTTFLHLVEPRHAILFMMVPVNVFALKTIVILSKFLLLSFKITRMVFLIVMVVHKTLHVPIQKMLFAMLKLVSSEVSLKKILLSYFKSYRQKYISTSYMTGIEDWRKKSIVQV